MNKTGHVNQYSNFLISRNSLFQEYKLSIITIKQFIYNILISCIHVLKSYLIFFPNKHGISSHIQTSPLIQFPITLYSIFLNLFAFHKILMSKVFSYILAFHNSNFINIIISPWNLYLNQIKTKDKPRNPYLKVEPKKHEVEDDDPNFPRRNSEFPMPPYSS